jgi:hypothetical protein
MKSVVDYLIEELLKNRLLALRYDADGKIDEIIQKAKELEKEQAIKTLEFGHTIFTKSAPMEYVIREFEKLKQ